MSTLKVYTPYNEELIKEIPKIDLSEAQKRLHKAHSLFIDRSKHLAPYQRIAILEKAMEIIKGRSEELAFESAREGGKPLIDSRVEVNRGINGIKVAIEHMSQMKGEEIPMNLTPSSANRLAFTTREPRGVVFAISAFNHPFNLIIHQVIPAIAVGCPVLVKPASSTPLSCLNIVEILQEAGLPDGWCQDLIISGSDAGKLLTDNRISFLTFIGSGNVGWKLRSTLPKGATCALEHGGAAPVIFHEDADLE